VTLEFCWQIETKLVRKRSTCSLTHVPGRASNRGLERLYLTRSKKNHDTIRAHGPSLIGHLGVYVSPERISMWYLHFITELSHVRSSRAEKCASLVPRHEMLPTLQRKGTTGLCYLMKASPQWSEVPTCTVFSPN
jgi:hypothetical protein